MKKLLPILLIAFSASASELVPAVSSGVDEDGYFCPQPVEDGVYTDTGRKGRMYEIHVALPRVTVSSSRDLGKDVHEDVERACIANNLVVLFLAGKRAKVFNLAEPRYQEYENATYGNLRVAPNLSSIRIKYTSSDNK